jgi:hypothetical protein
MAFAYSEDLEHWLRDVIIWSIGCLEILIHFELLEPCTPPTFMVPAQMRVIVSAAANGSSFYIWWAGRAVVTA